MSIFPDWLYNEGPGGGTFDPEEAHLPDPMDVRLGVQYGFDYSLTGTLNIKGNLIVKINEISLPEIQKEIGPTLPMWLKLIYELNNNIDVVNVNSIFLEEETEDIIRVASPEGAILKETTTTNNKPPAPTGGFL